MKYRFDGFNWVVRLERGERLAESLESLVKKENLPSVWILGLGAAEWAELGYYDLKKKEYSWKKFDQPLEITSLQGNSSYKDGELILHIHGNFSDENFNSIGGHVKELEVGGTCEILLHRWYKEDFKRALDEDTGLNLLNL